MNPESLHEILRLIWSPYLEIVQASVRALDPKDAKHQHELRKRLLSPLTSYEILNAVAGHYYGRIGEDKQLARHLFRLWRNCGLRTDNVFRLLEVAALLLPVDDLIRLLPADNALRLLLLSQRSQAFEPAAERLREEPPELLLFSPIEFAAIKHPSVPKALFETYNRHAARADVTELDMFVQAFAALLPEPEAVEALWLLAQDDYYEVRETASRALAEAGLRTDHFMRRLLLSQGGSR